MVVEIDVIDPANPLLATLVLPDRCDPPPTPPGTEGKIAKYHDEQPKRTQEKLEVS